MSDRSSSAIRSLLVLALSVSLAGCEQAEDTTGFKEFNELPKKQEPTKPETDVAAAEKSSANKKETAAKEYPSVPVPDVTSSESETEWVPLVAVKPVFADSTAGVKDNIENTGSPEGELREVKLLIPENSFKEEGPEQAIRISYDDFDLLKVLNMEPVPSDAISHFPGWLAGLEGKRVRVRGFMYPPFREEGLKQFILARDNQICCFGRNPKIYDLVHIKMREGVTASYIQNRPFDVVGTFQIRPDNEEGEWYGLYELADAIVLDK